MSRNVVFYICLFFNCVLTISCSEFGNEQESKKVIHEEQHNKGIRAFVLSGKNKQEDKLIGLITILNGLENRYYCLSPTLLHSLSVSDRALVDNCAFFTETKKNKK